jgi:hypothetical protein
MSLAIRKEREQPDERVRGGRRWVVVGADGRGWYVRFGGSRHVDRYSNVTQAIHRGRKLAHQNKPAGLVVRYLDGVEEESWYERPEDP